MNRVYLLSGSNMGDRKQLLNLAEKLLDENGVRIIQLSDVFETDPWGKADQGAFLNRALLANTSLDPSALMTTILKTEEQIGRIRTEKYGPRSIDIDILFYNHEIIHEAGLQIPHPEIANRRFVLEPMNQIAPHFYHPALHKTIHELLIDCRDMSGVKKFHD